MSLFAKLWTDILGDTKLMRAARLGAKQLHLLPWLIVFAKNADDDGRLTVGGDPAEPVDIAHGIPCVTPKQVAAALVELTELGVLAADEHGALQFVAWEHRSGHKPSDSAEAIGKRVAKHRARKREELANGNALQVTPSNATEKEKELDQELEQDEEGASHDSVDVLVSASLKTLAGDQWPDVRRFLASRAVHTRGEWIREMVKLVGPGSQFTAADLSGGCCDALMLDEPLRGPSAFRAFLGKRKLERTMGDVGAPMAPPKDQGPQIEAQRIVTEIRRLMQRNGSSRFIPRSSVVAMGERVIRAYDAVGGADRFLSDDVKFLPFEFARALAADQVPAGLAS